MESTKDGTKQRLLRERLATLGIGVLGFDFSYVGESEGEFADLTFGGEVEDLGGAWDFVRGSDPGQVALVGSSMGGAVALLFAGSEPGVAAIATIAAVGRPERMLAELRPDEIARWRAAGTFSLGGVRLRSTFLDDLDGIDVLAACRGIRCPVLVIHGDQDHVVPPSDADEIAAALGGASELEIVPGADHRFSRPEHLDWLLDRVVDWLAPRFLGTAS
jgi:pimeloyl-ACP methyl ester carboxylesterase